MATQEKNRECHDLVRKLTMGESLEDAEKSHLAVCETCMAEVVKTLDEAAASHSEGHDMALGETNGNSSRRASPEAKRALEQGCRVIEREFGIYLSKL
jgi:protein-arginine kinase activator protein McsA